MPWGDGFFPGCKMSSRLLQVPKLNPALSQTKPYRMYISPCKCMMKQSQATPCCPREKVKREGRVLRLGWLGCVCAGFGLLFIIVIYYCYLLLIDCLLCGQVLDWSLLLSCLYVAGTVPYIVGFNHADKTHDECIFTLMSSSTHTQAQLAVQPMITD